MLILLARNLTGTKENGTSDYDVEVSINQKQYVWCGTIKGHVRDDGAAKLLRLIADEIDNHPRSVSGNG